MDKKISIFRKKKTEPVEEQTWRREKPIPDSLFTSYMHNENPKSVKNVTNLSIDSIKTEITETNINRPDWMNEQSYTRNDYRSPVINYYKDIQKNTDLINNQNGRYFSDKYSSGSFTRTNSGTNRNDSSNLTRIQFDPKSIDKNTRFENNVKAKSGFGKNPRNQIDDPKLREYYDLENRINKAMEIQSDSNKSNSKQIDIFVRPNIKQTSYVKSNNILPNPSSNINDRLTEITAAKNAKTNRLRIFNNIKTEASDQSTYVDKSFKNIENKTMMTEFEPVESTYLNTMNENELQVEYNKVSKKLKLLEDKYHSVFDHPQNITYLNSVNQDLKNKLDEQKKKQNYLQKEIQLLLEDINVKKEKINNLSKLTSRGSGVRNEGNKEDYFKRIDNLKTKNQQLKMKIDNSEVIKRQNISKWSSISAKNMEYELSSMQMNLSNYEDDLIKEMNFFLNK